jgi:hypothetical protein
MRLGKRRGVFVCPKGQKLNKVNIGTYNSNNVKSVAHVERSSILSYSTARPFKSREY